MRLEKKYLVEEVDSYLEGSDYLFIVNYAGITVAETEDLRSSLAEHRAEFHVVKNTILQVATRGRSYPDLDEWLSGPTAIISGGENPPGVAKVLENFAKKKEKVDLKVGVLNESVISPEAIEQLSKLPSLEVLRAQLLGLLNTPAQRLLTVLQGVPQGLLNVLDAKSQES